MAADFDPSTLQDLLQLYYERLFPTELMVKWLSYGDADFFARREFSFTLTGDVYLRYQSFSGKEELAKELRRRVPEKIDIGAVYSGRPKMRETSSGFVPVEKEFVVDIDLTDYDDVRTCCTGAKVCEKCWKFLAVAVKILDAALRDDFGFKHLLWVYSGRRGVHCWVCDVVVRRLDDHARAAVIEYLSVIKGGENQAKKVKVPNADHIHPMLSRSIEYIEEVFDDICDTDQDVFNDEKNFGILPEEIKQACRNPMTRFKDVMGYIEQNNKKKSIKQLYPELLLQFCYPRLDVNVSNSLNHLLKSPFCIHPKTGQVCVPFDPKKVAEFRTFKVPNLSQVFDEIGQYDQNNGTENEPKIDLEKTSLQPFVKLFKSFVDKLQVDRSDKLLNQEKENRISAKKETSKELF